MAFSNIKLTKILKMGVMLTLGLALSSAWATHTQKIQSKIYNSGNFSTECHSGNRTTTIPPGGDQIFNMPIEQRIVCPCNCMSSYTMNSSGRQQHIRKCN